MNFHIDLSVALGTGANAAERGIFAFTRDWQAERLEKAKITAQS